GFLTGQGLDGAIRAQGEQSVPSFSSDRFLNDELLLGKLSETVVVVGNAPHNRPRFLICHLIGNVRASSARKRQCSGSQVAFLTISLPRHLSPGRSLVVFGEAVISADRARRFDTLRGAPARPSASAIRTASIPHHRAPSAFRTLRTMPAESVGLALPAAGRFR